MAVTAFRLENFMGFAANTDGSGEEDWIELRPICLLFGRNSSGKSAIIRSLRLLKQSLIYGTPDEPLKFTVEDGLNQGSFKETVFLQDQELPIRFHFRCEVTETIDELWNSLNLKREINGLSLISRENAISGKVDISLEFSWDLKSQKVILSKASVRVPWLEIQGDEQIIVFSASREKLIIQEESQKQWNYENEWSFSSCFLMDEIDTKYLLENNELPEVRISTQNGFLPMIEMYPLQITYDLRELEYLWEFAPNHPHCIVFVFQLAQRLLGELNNELEKFLHSIQYLGPVRPEPRRAYLLDQIEMEHWKNRGFGFFLEFIRGQISISQKNIINKKMQDLGLGKSIASSSMSFQDQAVLSRILIYEKEDTGVDINLTDVGFGASQVIPIIIQALTASPGTTVIIEQPELHLHPRAQAELADLFIAATKMKTNFFLETHSENLLLRFRRRVAESTTKKFVPDDDVYLDISGFAAYFVDRNLDEHMSTIQQILIGNLGELVSPPNGFKGFFSDDLKEIAALTKAMLDSKE